MANTDRAGTMKRSRGDSCKFILSTLHSCAFVLSIICAELYMDCVIVCSRVVSWVPSHGCVDETRNATMNELHVCSSSSLFILFCPGTTYAHNIPSTTVDDQQQQQQQQSSSSSSNPKPTKKQKRKVKKGNKKDTTVGLSIDDTMIHHDDKKDRKRSSKQQQQQQQHQQSSLSSSSSTTLKANVEQVEE